jgi:hypothetical protein
MLILIGRGYLTRDRTRFCVDATRHGTSKKNDGAIRANDESSM